MKEAIEIARDRDWFWGEEGWEKTLGTCRVVVTLGEGDIAWEIVGVTQASAFEKTEAPEERLWMVTHLLHEKKSFQQVLEYGEQLLRVLCRLDQTNVNALDVELDEIEEKTAP